MGSSIVLTDPRTLVSVANVSSTNYYTISSWNPTFGSVSVASGKRAMIKSITAYSYQNQPSSPMVPIYGYVAFNGSPTYNFNFFGTLNLTWDSLVLPVNYGFTLDVYGLPADGTYCSASIMWAEVD